MSGVRDSIEWATHTTNAVTGCLGPSGRPCSFCYAVRFRKRLAGVKGTIQHALREAGFDINAPAISLSRLDDLSAELSRARKPRRVFFGSMADLGYDGLYREVTSDGRVTPRAFGGATVRQWVRDLFARHPRHTFLILSKQPRGLVDTAWPDNAHVGVSLSSSRSMQRDRILTLREVTCGLRWASIEPLLSDDFDARCLEGLGWVVIGAETGPGASDPRYWADAAKRIVHWCAARGIPCFVKSNMRAADPGFAWPEEYPR